MELTPVSHDHRQAWREVTVDDLKASDEFALSTGPFGSSIGSRFFQEAGVPVIRGSNLSNDGQTCLIDDGLVFLSKEKAAEFRRSAVVTGDLVFTCWGTINQVGLISHKARYPQYIISNKQMKLTPDPSKADSLFLFYLFSGAAFQKQISIHSIGTSVPGFNLGRLRAIRFSVPNLPEQRAIAGALSDVDALLSALDSLLAKKRNLKQAAMQQLLTGQTRLPGFSGEWEVKRLRDVADVLKGRGLSRSALSASGKNPCILYGELFTTYGLAITSVVSQTDSDEGVPSKLGDVLMPSSTTTTGIDLATATALMMNGVLLGGDINIIRRNSGRLDPAFLASYLTETKRRAIAELAQGITIHHLYGRDLMALSLVIPSVAEQTAIATVLSDMDAEIDLLEARRAKTRDLKQAMMQELLTGRARLV